MAAVRSAWCAYLGGRCDKIVLEFRQRRCPVPTPVPAGRFARFATFEVDLAAGELRKHGIKIKLQEQPFQILDLLLEHAGEVVTREEIRDRLWPSDTFVDFDNSLNAAISKLRQAVGDTAENPRFVETLARRGYRFLAPVDRP